MSPSLFLTCFGLYVVAITLFGAWISRRNQSGDDFLLGGRSVPLFLTLGTTIATLIGTGSSMGAVGEAYASGWAGSLFGVGAFVGVVLLSLIFAPARRHGFMTMAEELSSYVGGSRVVACIVAVFTYLACVGWLGAHILGGAFYLQYVTGLNPTLAMTLIALGFAIYSTIGGYLAVVWTDTIQAIVLFIGFTATAALAFQSIGGLDGIREVSKTLAEAAPRPMGPAFLPLISLPFTIIVSVLATPSYRQRIYSGNSVSSIQKAFILSACLALCFAILPSIIGMAAFKHNSALEKSNLAFPYMATQVLPLALGVITLLAGLSATMSSASSDAIAGVTVVVRDLHELATGRVPEANRVILISRVALAVTTALALALAASADNIIGYIKDMVALFITGMCVCGVLGRLWPRFNAPGAVASLIAAFVTALIFRLQATWTGYWGGSVIPVFLCSVSLGVIVSLLTKPSMMSQEQVVEQLSQRRELMNAE